MIRARKSGSPGGEDSREIATVHRGRPDVPFTIRAGKK
jgi:hypothetical protein